MSASGNSGMYSNWNPLFGEAFDGIDDTDTSEDDQEDDTGPRTARPGRISRDHTGLCRRAHPGTRR